VAGANVHAHLPYGADALHWHGVFNEIQMLFYEHEVNQAREQRGETPVNAVWLWGGGKAATNLRRPFALLAGDSELARAFAQAMDIPALMPAESLLLGKAEQGGEVLLVWEGLRTSLQSADIAKWRASVQQFEADFAVPLLAALAAGQLEQITLDVLGEGESSRFVLTRSALWKLWRLPRPLLHYALSGH
jgi:hypothetical protein